MKVCDGEEPVSNRDDDVVLWCPVESGDVGEDVFGDRT
jgi:hypothetical protein